MLSLWKVSSGVAAVGTFAYGAWTGPTTTALFAALVVLAVCSGAERASRGRGPPTGARDSPTGFDPRPLVTVALAAVAVSHGAFVEGDVLLAAAFGALVLLAASFASATEPARNGV